MRARQPGPAVLQSSSSPRVLGVELKTLELFQNDCALFCRCLAVSDAQVPESLF